VDVVLELVGRDYGVRSLAALRPGGLLVTAVERTNEELRAKAVAADRRFAGLTVEPDHVGLEALASLVDKGALKIHVSHATPLQTLRAHTRCSKAGRPRARLS
jgi:NADPH:quinone reductase-like Zn-dependent oxidoreductase